MTLSTGSTGFHVIGVVVGLVAWGDLWLGGGAVFANQRENREQIPLSPLPSPFQQLLYSTVTQVRTGQDRTSLVCFCYAESLVGLKSEPVVKRQENQVLEPNRKKPKPS